MDATGISQTASPCSSVTTIVVPLSFGCLANLSAIIRASFTASRVAMGPQEKSWRLVFLRLLIKRSGCNRRERKAGLSATGAWLRIAVGDGKPRRNSGHLASRSRCGILPACKTFCLGFLQRGCAPAGDDPVLGALLALTRLIDCPSVRAASCNSVAAG